MSQATVPPQMTPPAQVEKDGASTDGGATATGDRRSLAVFETALILLGLATFGFVLPHTATADAGVRYRTLLALLDHGVLADNKFTIVGHLFALPLMGVARVFGRNELAWATMYNSVLFALAVGVLYLLLRHRLPGTLLRRFFLVLIVGSMFAAHVVQFNSEPFTALTVGVGLVAVAVRHRSLSGWAAIALGVANTTAALVPLALVVARRMWERRRVRYVLVGIAAVGLVMLDRWVRRGSPLRTGYEGDSGFPTVMPYSGRPGFSFPIFFGLLYLCLSFGKGLLFFAPGLILPVRGSMRRLTLRAEVDLYRLYGWWVLFAAGLVLVYAPWWAWYGGMTWGPRFLLFASLPASLALAVRLWDLPERLWLRLLTLVVLTMSAWVGLCAAVFPEAAFPSQCSAARYANEVLCHSTVEFSVLWYPLVQQLPVGRRDLAVIAYLAVVYCYLAAPLVRVIVRDIAGRVRPVGAGAARGWRW